MFFNNKPKNEQEIPLSSEQNELLQAFLQLIGVPPSPLDKYNNGRGNDKKLEGFGTEQEAAHFAKECDNPVIFNHYYTVTSPTGNSYHGEMWLVEYDA